MAVIAEGGFEARAVGGVVRNALLGLPVTDIDLATTALPQDVLRMARAAGMGVAETGLGHGTVTVIADHHTFEVTTLRRDVESHGRHATVAFTDDWAEDARRRDFTMNALYCGADGTVHDPLCGLDDLLARRVRFIGDAGERIREDYLRILRFFRFTAQYGESGYDAEGLAACTRERCGLGQLSAERIRQELVRLLVARGAVEATLLMQEHGILAQVLPAAPRHRLLARAVAIEQAHLAKKSAMTRLAALAVEVSEDATRLARALRLSRDEREALLVACDTEAHLSEAPPAREARALLYRRGDDGYRARIVLSWARALERDTGDRAWSDALQLPERWQAPRLAVDGADVMARGIAAGPKVGEALRALEAWWIERDFAPDRQALLARLDELVGGR
jgi:poly(A) polymerase